MANPGNQPAATRKSSRRQTRSLLEMRQRVEHTADLFRDGLKKGEVKRRLKAEYGCSSRSCETYISRAKQVLRIDPLGAFPWPYDGSA